MLRGIGPAWPERAASSNNEWIAAGGLDRPVSLRSQARTNTHVRCVRYPDTVKS